MSQRQLRVAELIQREVSVALRRNWITESALITITRATISPDLRQVRIGYAVSGGDPEKKAAREALVAGFLPAWARAAERNITAGPFFGGAKIHVVDLKIHMAVRWFNGGKVDHGPATIFAGYPKLIGVHDAVRDHPGI